MNLKTFRLSQLTNVFINSGTLRLFSSIMLIGTIQHKIKIFFNFQNKRQAILPKSAQSTHVFLDEQDIDSKFEIEFSNDAYEGNSIIKMCDLLNP